jgi:hypothetical protein
LPYGGGELGLGMGFAVRGHEETGLILLALVAP